MDLQIKASHIADMPTVVGDRFVVTVTVGPGLTPIVLSVRHAPDYRTQDATGASFAKKQADRPNDFRIHFLVGHEWKSIDLSPTTENFHHLQPHGENDWLLVRGRAADEKDCNAFIYDSRGEILRSFHLGDGIEDVQATLDGRIWASFFDEGVFSSVKTGNSGLICANAQGRVVFDYAAVGETVKPIDDCYALNVTSDRDTWLCYYRGFPVVHIADSRLANHWTNISVSGSHAFAVGDRRVLFAGDYDEHEVLFEIDLDHQTKRKLIPIGHDGKKLAGFSAFGRSNCLFLLAGASLYMIDMTTLPQ